MKELTIKENTYRIKQMNAIELLSIQTCIDLSNVDEAINTYNFILERLEVKIKDQWLPVKEKNKDIFYPADVENDFETLQKLITHFLSYIKEVFQKSNA